MSNSQSLAVESTGHVHSASCGCAGAHVGDSHLYAHGHLHLNKRAKAIIMPLSLGLLIASWLIYWLMPSQRFMADIYALLLAGLCGLPIIIGAIRELASGKAGLSLLSEALVL